MLIWKALFKNWGPFILIQRMEALSALCLFSEPFILQVLFAMFHFLKYSQMKHFINKIGYSNDLLSFKNK